MNFFRIIFIGILIYFQHVRSFSIVTNLLEAGMGLNTSMLRALDTMNNIQPIANSKISNGQNMADTMQSVVSSKISNKMQTIGQMVNSKDFGLSQITDVIQTIYKTKMHLYERFMNTIERLTQALLSIFDFIKWKFNFLENEATYGQCVAKSLLKANFDNRLINIMAKVVYEFIEFMRRAFGGETPNINTVLNTLNSTNIQKTLEDIETKSYSNQTTDVSKYDFNEILYNEYPSPNVLRRKRFTPEAFEAMNEFVTCSKTYLGSILLRVIQLFSSSKK